MSWWASVSSTIVSEEEVTDMFGLMSFTAFISCMIILSVQPSYGSEIIGGKAVKPHSMPFMALLGKTNLKCGGTLIHESWVLTAAHCNGSNTVSLGVHSIKSKEKERRSRQVRKVREFPHPWYNKKEHLHDLMLLKLDKPVEKTKTVNWLQLSKTVQYPNAGTVCVAAGWGRTKAGVTSDVLMSVKVPVIDRKICNSTKHYGGHPLITDSMVCAGTDNADTCYGDSGGPLLCNGALVGITSFGGKVCGTSERPGVYTFLTAEHLGWIKNVMKS